MTVGFAAEKTNLRILIVRLSAMGDVIHTLPAVQAVRRAFPRAYIGWLIEERWSELLCAAGAARRGARSALRPLVDEVHAVQLKEWKKSLSISSLQQMATIWNDVRDAGYDVAVDLQGAIRSAVLARWSRARVVYGAAEPRESPASLWYTRKVVARGRHVVEQNISVAAEVAGAKIGGDSIPVQSAVDQEKRSSYARRTAEGGGPHMEIFDNCATAGGSSMGCELPRDAEVEARVDRHLAELGVGGLAILNPGAGWGAKRWPAERYGEVARGLAAWGLRSILNYGPGEEELVGIAEAGSAGTACAMKCSITELIALTRRARLFIGGDTGPLHLAAALGVPVVAIYGPTDPARNGPYGTRRIVLRNPQSVTSHARRAEAEDGLLAIGSDAVVAAARELLGEERGG